MPSDTKAPREPAPAPPSARGEGSTLCVGVGSFGAEILTRLASLWRRVEPAHAPAVLLALGTELGPSEAAARVVGEAEKLLGLERAVRASGAGDASRPALDLLLVGDLGDAEVARALPAIVRESATRLLERFSNIFPGNDPPNLALCPVVALLGIRQPEAAKAAPEPGASAAPDPRQALGELAAAATEITFRSGQVSPVARVFVVEQQASRYELTRGEVASSVVAFLSLLLGAALRHQEPLRTFLRSPVGEARERRIFASFGCATLELELESYCVTRAAAELLDGIRSTASAAAGAEAVAAERLVPDAAELERSLQSPASGDDLIELLRAHTPQVDFPPIGWQDTPEQIREQSYGWGWFDALESAVQATVKELDEHEMDEVTRVADERGLAALRSLERDVRGAIRDAERSGPHGWAEGLRLAEHVRNRADRQLGELGSALRKQKLPEFPAPTIVESAFRELRQESTLRPRPYRMAFFGAFAAVVAAALLHHLPKWFAVGVGARQVPLLSLTPSTMDVEVGAWRFLLDPPWAFVWVLGVVGGLTAWWLRRYRRKRHEALLATREGLQGAVGRYLTDEVGPSVRRYYESRLRFTLTAWARRALRRARDVAHAEAARLGAVSAGLDRLSQKLRDEAARVERAPVEHAGDMLYRSHASAELLESSYQALRPGAELAATLFGEIGAGEHDDEPPAYLIEDRLRELVRPHVRPSEHALGALATPVVERFVSELHGKLGVPLEVRGFDPRMAEQHHLFAPRWAVGALERLRERLPTLPAPMPHDDAERVHLLTVQTALDLDSIVLPRQRGGP